MTARSFPAQRRQTRQPLLGLDAVKEIADRIVGSGGLSGGVQGHTVATEADLPADIQAQAEGLPVRVVAVHQGRDIYLVADRHPSAAKVEESILHEGSCTTAPSSC